jgi:hypothetical protein
MCLLSFFVAYCHLSYAQSTTHKLVLDHIIIWIEKDAPIKKLLEEKGFISKSDAVQLHNGFGTAGKYISTYNLLLEFLYVNDKADYDSNYHKTLSSKRDNWGKNKKCLFGIAFEMIPFDSTKIPFDSKEVRAAWMYPFEALYTATSNYTHD